MNPKRIKLRLFGVGLAIVFATAFTSNLSTEVSAQQHQAQAPAVSPAQKQIIAAFEQRVKGYVKLREHADNTVPKLSKDSTPEQIETHKKAFEEAVRVARVGAKAGDLFAADISDYIRAMLRNEFRGKDRQELRSTIFEAETQGVPLKVNFPYPEKKEFAAMPAALLLKLPQLPKELRYRFVSRHLLLVDRQNGLILDYMLNAFP